MLRHLIALTIVLLALAIQSQANLVGRQQSVAVRGIVTCNGKPQSGLKIKLKDHDTFTPSDNMGQTVSAQDGSFYMAGHNTEISNIVPEVRIYHKCGHFFFRHCSKFRIPSSYVTWSAAPQSTYEAGEIKLETMTSNC